MEFARGVQDVTLPDGGEEGKDAERARDSPRGVALVLLPAAELNVAGLETVRENGVWSRG